MRDDVDYQQRAIECAKQAQSALNSEARLIWKRMAEFWRERAERPKLKLTTFAALKSIPGWADRTNDAR